MGLDHSVYKGWSISYPGLTGWWTAWKSGGGGYLKADTLAGLRQLVTAFEKGEVSW